MHKMESGTSHASAAIDLSSDEYPKNSSDEEEGLDTSESQGTTTTSEPVSLTLFDKVRAPKRS